MKDTINKALAIYRDLVILILIIMIGDYILN